MNEKTKFEAWLNSQGAATVKMPPTVLKPGDHAGRYRVVAFLGRGGFAEVYGVADDDLRCDYALKLFTGGGPDSTERFLNEARALARLDHPNLVRIHAFGEAAGRPFFVMELLNPLPDVLTVREARHVVTGVCDALMALHRAGLVHRDVKRANVLMRGNVPVLADLGAVKGLGGLVSCVIVGTPGAAAPEQLGGGKITAATDIYTLGLFTRSLFAGPLPRFWRGIVRKATAALPEDRYASARAFKRAVLGWAFVVPALLRAAGCLLCATALVAACFLGRPAVERALIARDAAKIPAGSPMLIDLKGRQLTSAVTLFVPTGGLLVVKGPGLISLFEPRGAGRVLITGGAVVYAPLGDIETCQRTQDYNRYWVDRGSKLHVMEDRTINVHGLGQVERMPEPDASDFNPN